MAFNIYQAAALMYILIGVLGLLSPGPLPRAASVGVFSLLIWGFIFFILIGFPLYSEMGIDNIPVTRRGHLFARAAILRSSASLLGTFLSAFAFRNAGFPESYYLRFLTAGVFLSLASAHVRKISDNLNPGYAMFRKKPPILLDTRFLLRKLMRNPNYRIFIFFYTVLIVSSSISFAFIIPYAHDSGGLTARQVSLFAQLWFVSSLAFGPFLGKLGDKSGYRAVGALMAGFLMLSQIAILLHPSIPVFMAAYIPMSLASASVLTLLNNMSAELCADIPPSRLVSIGSVIPIPFIFLIVTLCGQILDRSQNYLAVYIISVTLAAIALAGFALLVREPRRSRLVVLKPLNWT